jgi:hypothetical protein
MVAWRYGGMSDLPRFRARRQASPPVMGVDAPPPRPTFGAALLLALVLSGLWVAAVTFATLVSGAPPH